MAGPTSTPRFMPSELKALAATISSCRTVRGINASREGRCSEDEAARRNAATKMSVMLGSGRNALTASIAVKPAWATPVHTSSLRRSTWSASAPP